MLKCRVIPILTFNGFGLVKTKGFARNPRMVGNAVQATKVYNSRNVDELVFLDIYASDKNRKMNLQLAKLIINECFMPVALGGGIKTIEDIHDLLAIGADKVVLKSKIIEDPEFINKASQVFGNQCITLAIDAFKQDDGKYYLYNRLKKTIDLFVFLEDIKSYNFGEIILTSVNNDGMMNGFDIELVNKVEKIIHVPIVVAGGAGNLDHFKELFSKSHIEAVAAASIFHFTQYTPRDIKLAIASVGKPVRIVEKMFIPKN
ncbi:imidazole glycerol phosphate synthase cyclase subunit [Changchengzhania lutea]|uniref:imidazole glycerol phosphate synthase cyclase subunit n=1 Tax=Changchengzhania lutea TaxID=2049305 RepID=UPI00115E613A|nr:imidazole glycerol phosphate synthase cyclase subunit [Changchengzhania lutea]